MTTVHEEDAQPMQPPAEPGAPRNGDKAALTPGRKDGLRQGRKDGKRKDPAQLVADVSDLMRGIGISIGARGDVDALPLLAGLIGEADAVLSAAVVQLHSAPYSYSWAEIGQRLGITRQAAQMRYGRAITHTELLLSRCLADLAAHPDSTAREIGRRLDLPPRDVFRALDRGAYTGRCQRWRNPGQAWRWEIPAAGGDQL